MRRTKRKRTMKPQRGGGGGVLIIGRINSRWKGTRLSSLPPLLNKITGGFLVFSVPSGPWAALITQDGGRGIPSLGLLDSGFSG